MNRNGRARVNPRWPQASAICDRCGALYNHVDLRFQMRWAGNTLVNTGLLVCDRCRDDANPQLRPFIAVPDPVPIRDPRPEPYATDVLGGMMEGEGGYPLKLETGSQMFLESP